MVSWLFAVQKIEGPARGPWAHVVGLGCVAVSVMISTHWDVPHRVSLPLELLVGVDLFHLQACCQQSSALSGGRCSQALGCILSSKHRDAVADPWSSA